MAPKRKAKEVADVPDDDNAGEGASTKDAPKETSGQRDARKLKERTDKNVQPAEVLDNALVASGAMPTSVPTDEWVEKLAVHLASEGAFLQYMKNPGDPADIIIPLPWLAMVYLPGRTKFFNDFMAWVRVWWSKSKNSHKLEVLERASEIASACLAPGQSSIKGSMAPLPLNDENTVTRRENLFKVQTTRSKMVEATKSITDTQHGLAQALITTISKDFDDQASAEREELVDELSQLDEVKTSAREVLEASSLNKTGIEVIDGFLKLVDADTKLGVLHQLGDDDQFPIFTASEEPVAESEARFPEEQVVDVDVIAAKIQEVYGVPIDYLAGRKLNDSKPNEVCQVRASGKRFQAVQVTKPLRGKSIVGKKELTYLDSTSAQWLKEMAATFDEKRFILNFRDFEALVTRPEDCAKASSGANYWIRKHNHLDIARDNIAHVRRLVCHMRENDMISDLDNLQVTMRRLYALLALIYGCVAEGAILLTVMDQLLENLAKSVIGNVNPKLESSKMQSAIRLMHQQPSMRKRALAINDLKRQEREHKAREVFAEVVRFYHGAAILLFSAASGGKSEEVDSRTVKWWEGIINLSSKCGHSKCVDQLEIKKSKKVTGEGDRWALSIAVKDSRIGFPEERSLVSSNRKTAYPCLYDIVFGRRFHVAYAPFFHYFAHLWHPTCRAYRGKSSLVDDMVAVETHEAALAEMRKEEDPNADMLFDW